MSSLSLNSSYYKSPSFRRMFKQFLLLLLISQMASGLFRFIAALGRNMIVANTFGSFALLAIMTLGGFIVSRGTFKNMQLLIEGANFFSEFLSQELSRVLFCF